MVQAKAPGVRTCCILSYASHFILKVLSSSQLITVCVSPVSCLPVHLNLLHSFLARLSASLPAPCLFGCLHLFCHFMYVLLLPIGLKILLFGLCSFATLPLAAPGPTLSSLHTRSQRIYFFVCFFTVNSPTNVNVATFTMCYMTYYMISSILLCIIVWNLYFTSSLSYVLHLTTMAVPQERKKINVLFDLLYESPGIVVNHHRHSLEQEMKCGCNIQEKKR